MKCFYIEVLKLLVFLFFSCYTCIQREVRIMVQRKQYMEKLIKMKDKKIIKVVTGIRRCGKSTLLFMFRNYLKECGVEDSQIISVNFEDVANEPLLDYRKLHEYVNERLNPDKMTYVFLDGFRMC